MMQTVDPPCRTRSVDLAQLVAQEVTRRVMRIGLSCDVAIRRDVAHGEAIELSGGGFDGRDARRWKVRRPVVPVGTLTPAAFARRAADELVNAMADEMRAQ